MRAKRITGALLLAAGLLSSGCGGTAVETDAQGGKASREDAIWLCDGSMGYRIDYYDDAALTQWAGMYDCTCDGSLYFEGRRTRYQDSNTWQCGG
ncbi:hypothetical protein [Vitiosangium sp. GDMCC 1.1324]|uniref:hypothetical protein n=1 Tax=Vitiosangium sp. (strain GDMCC 1.1324) TaxID=2138576 RepID=UPI000D333CE4|nr:hypothetical protein [Vitiosangium sp. GDMCC 1.1324]PTL83051.1 hypothetical protein DAT35_13615 [Vitiosangium sp. GDMCC 1.1324]